MKLHIQTVIISLITTVLSLFGIFRCQDNAKDICVGLFASGVFVLATSVINYLALENRNCQEYCWRLHDLTTKMEMLHHLSLMESLDWRDVPECYQLLSDINSLISGYFASCDLDYFWKKREKIKLIIETTNILIHNSQIIYDAAKNIFQLRLHSETEECSGEVQTMIKNVCSQVDCDALKNRLNALSDSLKTRKDNQN